MKIFTPILSVLAASILFTALAQEPKQLYEVRCPNCLFKGLVLAQNVLANGGYSFTNYFPVPPPTNAPPGFVPGTIAIPGSMQQLSAMFHCRECHFDFTAPVKPDRFVPQMPAEAVSRPGIWPNPPGMPDMPVATVAVPGGSVSGPAYTVEPATAWDGHDHGPAVTNTVQLVERQLRVVPIGDGSEYVVYHEGQVHTRHQTNGLEQLIRVIPLPNGSEFAVYRRPSTAIPNPAALAPKAAAPTPVPPKP